MKVQRYKGLFAPHSVKTFWHLRCQDLFRAFFISPVLRTCFALPCAFEASTPSSGTSQNHRSTMANQHYSYWQRCLYALPLLRMAVPGLPGAVPLTISSAVPVPLRHSRQI